MLGTRIETGRAGVARSTVDMHRIRVRDRASVGATFARRTYSPAPYLCMRIDATRPFGTEIVHDKRISEPSKYIVVCQNTVDITYPNEDLVLAFFGRGSPKAYVGNNWPAGRTRSAVRFDPARETF
ncbi:hypothetical protein EVAR_61455_1 [Eumeta japonica]|uniref:Uncharacterized protein n=1 Tax=Eumeta variegata TaxID=151549 RepID=A0A4C1Z318_EUMVA|nr:hypothetical protein EVAR_61455_1 [Eumeta japonica]